MCRKQYKGFGGELLSSKLLDLMLKFSDPVSDSNNLRLRFEDLTLIRGDLRLICDTEI
jgi:hypothetical protein